MRCDRERGEWFAHRRDLLVKNVVRDFLTSCRLFHSIKGHTFTSEEDYELLHHWIGNTSEKGPFWQLKDTCHLLWKGVDPAHHPHYFLFDWLVGAAFHEAMKLKECAYLISRYEPAFSALAIHPSSREGEFSKCELFFQETKADVNSIVGRMECLFSRAMDALVEIVAGERGNPILLRYLVEEPPQCEELLGHLGGSRYLLSRMFPEGIHHAYTAAGESYLEGGWYSEARLSFERALQLAPGDQEALKGLTILEKRLKELSLHLAQGPGPVGTKGEEGELRRGETRN